VEVSVPAASLELKGKIDTLSVAANTQGQYSLRINLDNKDGLLKPGMFASVTLKTATKDDVVVVPTDAVVFHGGRYVVYTADGNKAVEKEVETGLDNGQETEITSGLQEGDILIIKGQHFIKDGSEIKIVTLDGQDIAGGQDIAAPGPAGSAAAVNEEGQTTGGGAE